MNKGKIAGIILIILCVLVNLFEGARMEALAPSVIFCIIGLILIIKNLKKKKYKRIIIIHTSMYHYTIMTVLYHWLTILICFCIKENG